MPPLEIRTKNACLTLRYNLFVKDMFNISFKHNLAPYPCHVLFMFMFAYVSITKIHFFFCIAHFVFLFIIIMFLFLNHIILFCSLFESQLKTFSLAFVLMLLCVLNRSSPCGNQATHFVSCTESPNDENSCYNHKKIGTTFDAIPTICVSSTNEG